ncbi:MAG TPA: transposase, partial [Alphaproteobacteria bacterium]|nr:transposase [Alphaproteobacteria bacterium]
LHRKFGEMPEQVIEKVTEARSELIEQWSENVLFANSLEEVFAS